MKLVSKDVRSWLPDYTRNEKVPCRLWWTGWVCHFQWCYAWSPCCSFDLDKWKLRMDTLFSSSLITSRWFCGSLWGQSGFPWLGHNSLVKRGEQLQVLVDLAIWAAFPLGFSGLLCANPPQVPAGDLGSGSDLRGASRGSAGASGALVLRTEPP